MDYSSFGGGLSDHGEDPNPALPPDPIAPVEDETPPPEPEPRFWEQVAQADGWTVSLAATAMFLVGAAAMAYWLSNTGIDPIQTFLFGMRSTGTIAENGTSIDITIPILGVPSAGFVACRLLSRYLRRPDSCTPLIHGTRTAALTAIVIVITGMIATSTSNDISWKPHTALAVALAAPLIAATTGAARSDRRPALVSLAGPDASPWSAAAAAGGLAAKVAFVVIVLLSLGANGPFDLIAESVAGFWPNSATLLLGNGVYEPYRLIAESDTFTTLPYGGSEDAARLAALLVVAALTIGTGAALESLRYTGTHLVGAVAASAGAGSVVWLARQSLSINDTGIDIGPSPGMTALLVLALTLVLAPLGRIAFRHFRPACRLLGLDLRPDVQA